MRTTLNIDDTIYKRLVRLASDDNRSLPNLVETLLLRILQEDLYIDEDEAEIIRSDKTLEKSIKSGLADYKSRRGKFV